MNFVDRWSDLRCPRCSAPLACETTSSLAGAAGTAHSTHAAVDAPEHDVHAESGVLTCAACARRVPVADGVASFASDDSDVAPAKHDALARALERLRVGTPFKAALEELLLALDDAGAERTMLLLREGRGAWHPELDAGAGSLLLCANGFSGAAVPLAAAGFDVTVLDVSAARAAFGEFRNRALAAPGRRSNTRAVVCAREARLPFADGAFDVVVQEGGLPGEANAFAHDLAECRRVAKSELVLIADNRLGYKRSAGRRGVFHVPSPAVWLRDALVPRHGERTLAGYRGLVARDGFAPPRAFALYPHSREFAHVVALDAAWPKLSIGPKERRNRLKIVADRAGLFPLLTPSYALFARRAPSGRPRVERLLDELAERIGEPRPRVEQWVATRGNTIVWLCAANDDERDARGRWCVHVPLSPQQREQLERHHATITTFRARFPNVPVPEPLFLGALDAGALDAGGLDACALDARARDARTRDAGARDAAALEGDALKSGARAASTPAAAREHGVFLACERRIAGLTAPQLTGEHRAAARLFADCAEHLARLVVAPARPLDRAGFDALIGAKCELVARFCAVASTRKSIEALAAELERELLGVALPRVWYHADLRSKHVQVDADGRVLGFLDWGSSEPEGLPYFDLLHLIAHERKQEAGLSAAEAWRIVGDPRALRTHELGALDAYAGALRLDPQLTRAIVRLYPVLVGAMAEKNWDYSRPRWVHRQFGL
ncbi:MAG: methyltransferase domain-containing protein [Planctomycetes bacterium]|nr:methyltransferase domain-containing protein [Planctomycetota bacterium]